MRLKNKQTGEIGLVHCDATMFSNKIGVFIDNNHIDLRNPYKVYDSLAELNAEWEDVPEEPKECWYISEQATVVKMANNPKDIPNFVNRCSSFGNLFESKEEAEAVVEKLKAFKRLKDKGFEFRGWTFDDGLRISICTNTDSEGIYDDDKKDLKKDLDLVFGGEE